MKASIPGSKIGVDSTISSASKVAVRSRWIELEAISERWTEPTRLDGKAREETCSLTFEMTDATPGRRKAHHRACPEIVLPVSRSERRRCRDVKYGAYQSRAGILALPSTAATVRHSCFHSAIRSSTAPCIFVPASMSTSSRVHQHGVLSSCCPGNRST